MIQHLGPPQSNMQQDGSHLFDEAACMHHLMSQIPWDPFFLFLLMDIMLINYRKYVGISARKWRKGVSVQLIWTCKLISEFNIKSVEYFQMKSLILKYICIALSVGLKKKFEKTIVPLNTQHWYLHLTHFHTGTNGNKIINQHFKTNGGGGWGWVLFERDRAM